MARYRTKVVEPVGQYHSDDPRQMSMDIVAEKPTATAGRPAVSALEAELTENTLLLASTCVPFEKAVEATVDESFVRRGGVDRLAEEVRRVTGAGPRLNWCGAGDCAASTLVRVDWHSAGQRVVRFGYFRDARTALLCVLEYERVLAAEGSEAAELFRDKARCRTESEAVARMDEEDGVVREDPKRADPKYKRGDR